MAAAGGKAAVRLHVEVSGSGPDVVLLHGWGMSAAVWDDLSAALAPHFRVLCVDLPGHGASAACSPLTLDAMAGALAACVPARVSVCGWSLGAQLALTWARLHPQQVTRLILIAGTPRFVNGADWTRGIDASVLDAFAADLEGDFPAALNRFLALQVRGDADARNVLRHLRERVRLGGFPDPTAAAAGLRILKDGDLRDFLPRLPQPALILHGTHDQLVPLAAGEFLQRELPNARLAVIAGAAHAPFVAHVNQVARSIEEFCREQ